MTESPFPFGAVEDGPAAAEPAEAGSRRNLLLLGGLAAVLLAGGAYVLLGGGEEAVEDVAFTPRAPRAAAAAGAAAPKPAKLPVATKVPLGRNPFKALYVAPVAAAAAPAGTTQNTPTSTTAPTSGTPIVVVAPVTLPTGTTTPPTSGGTVAAPAARPSTQSTVALKGVSTRTGKAVGTFVYDGQTVTGGKGQVMAGKLKVMSLVPLARGGWYATLKLGDGAAFEVHENQTVVVQ